MKGPNFDIAFSIGKLHIYWYAILLALGIAVAMLFTDRRAKGRKVPKDIALDLCILALPFGILGGRLFACLSGMVTWNNFFDLSRPGLSFFGAMFFGAVAILVSLKHRKVQVGEMLDIAAPGIFAGIGIGTLTSRMFVPMLQTAYAASNQVLPMKLIVNQTDMNRLYVVIAGVMALCLITLITIVFKLNVTKALKLGEE